MTKAEALEIVADAAQEWSREICEYIVPDSLGMESDEKRAKWTESDNIDRAIHVLTGRYPGLEKTIAELWNDRNEELAE